MAQCPLNIRLWSGVISCLATMLSQWSKSRFPICPPWPWMIFSGLVGTWVMALMSPKYTTTARHCHSVLILDSRLWGNTYLGTGGKFDAFFIVFLYFGCFSGEGGLDCGGGGGKSPQEIAGNNTDCHRPKLRHYVTTSLPESANMAAV